jgi:hypothetical protein
MLFTTPIFFYRYVVSIRMCLAELIETMLIGTPLATRGIRLVESAEGGAMVVVGLKRYPGVGDVPDPEVQAAIRAAIAEWEKKYTPG